MPLTDTAIRNAKPGAKPIKMFDERGLFLLVAPAGGKWWRLKYRVGGKEKLLSLGTYPDVGLKDARELREDARKLLAKGVDPSVNRRAQTAAGAARAANSFEVVAREWYAKNSSSWVKEHGDRIIRRLERDVFPAIGGRPVSEVTAPELLEVVRRIENRGALETAHRALSNCGQVFRYAIATGAAVRDVSADLRGALPPSKPTHFPAVTEPKQAGALLAAMAGYQGTFTVQCALYLSPLLFVRPGELRTAKWEEIDLDQAEWRYTVSKTKTQHIVPLATQAVAKLRELQQLTGSSQYVFPGARTNGRPMSKEEMTGHGFRAMARTILDEVLGIRPELIEHQLAHAVKDPNGRAYNRTAHLPERRKMMQTWADYLDRLKSESHPTQRSIKAFDKRPHSIAAGKAAK
jgi:integrase